MKLLNIVSLGNDSALEGGDKLPTIDNYKVGQKPKKLKKGKYGMNGPTNYSGTTSQTDTCADGGVE